MANIPELRSSEQIIGDIIDAFLARAKGVNDLNEGSVLLQYIDAVGRNIFRSSADVIQMIDAFSVDRAVGEALQRIAIDNNVPILSAQSAIGKVKIIDISFKKIETSIYAGQPAPVAGSIVIHVTDASNFNENGGNIYIDRGEGQLSANVEGPLKYTSITQEGGGAYWAINLDVTNPTTKFHNTGEKILFAQGGDRSIAIGTVVTTKSGATNQISRYSTSSVAIILDGDTTVENVPIIATDAGPQNNTFRGAITEVTGLGFSAAAFNEQPVTGGLPSDSDETLRNRIKRYEQTKARGTSAAIQSSIIDVVAPDDLKRVSSSSVVDFSDSSSALIFDDGTGYEVITNGVGVEQIVDESLGGEREIQLRQYPVAIARVSNINVEPYNIVNGEQLGVTIKGDTRTHQFLDSDFKVKGKATALEVVASINGNPNIHFFATTGGGSTLVVLYPRDRFSNDIKVEILPSNDSNDVLDFPTITEFTLRLYRNDEPLHEDGLLATLSTKAKPTWAQNISDGDTLIYKVDGTPEITAVFTLSDFQLIDPTATVSFFTDIDIWAQVMNNKMPGIDATVSADVINLTSNRGANDLASFEITGGSLFLKIFEQDLAISEGRSSDYTLNKNTGQVGLTSVMLPGESISAGSPITRANVLTSSLPSGPPSGGNLWFVVDGNIILRSNNLTPTTLISFSKDANGLLEILAEDALAIPEGFDEAEVGDWLLIWSELTDTQDLQDYSRFWRIIETEVGRIVVDDAGNPPAIPNGAQEIHSSDRFVIIKSPAPLQRLAFSVGTLNDLREEIEEQLSGVSAEIIGSSVRISSKSLDASVGQIAVVAADAGGKSIGFTTAIIKDAVSSHNGFTVVSDSEVSIPSFTHGEIGTKITPAIFQQLDFKTLQGKESDFIEVLNLYDNDPNNLHEIIDSNKLRRAAVLDFDDTSLVPSFNMKLDLPGYLGVNGSQIQENDRFYFRDGFRFDSEDLINIIVDGDSNTKSFALPISRGLVVNSALSTPTLLDFSADDAQSSLSLGDPSSFFDFSFNNFKLWRKSNIILSDGNYGIRFQNGDFGPSGDLIGVGFIYPANASEDEITHRISVGETISIGLVIPASQDRGSDWDGTTSFTVDLISTTGGKDVVKYEWKAGTEPDFLTLGVIVGDVAFINNSANFLSGNKDVVAKIINVTATSFTIERPTGDAVSDSLSIIDFDNEDGITVITTDAPHNLSPGDRIGLYDTAIVTGSLVPFDDNYTVVDILSSTKFTVDTPLSVNEGSINSASHSASRVKVVSPNHGLDVGNIIKVANAGSPYTGLAVVVEILDVNTFTYRREGGTISITSGDWYFQSYDSGINAFTVASASTTSGSFEIDFVTTLAHSYSVNDLIEITGVDPEPWSGTIAYPAKTVVEYNGINYFTLIGSSLAGTTAEITEIDTADGNIGNTVEQTAIDVSTGSIGGLQERTNISMGGIVAAGLDGQYFILWDKNGSVAFWFDIDDSGTTIPSGALAADRAVEITTVNTGDFDFSTAAKIGSVINSDSEFTTDIFGSTTVPARSIGGGLKNPTNDTNTGDTAFVFTTPQVGTESASFVIQDFDGSVGVWFDPDNTGMSVPDSLVIGAGATTRTIEVSTILYGDSDTTIAAKISAVINSDIKFTSVPSTTFVNVIDTQFGSRPPAENRDSGFTISQTEAGSDDGDYFIIYDSAGSVGVWYDVDNNGTTIPTAAASANRSIEITTVVSGDTDAIIASKTAIIINSDSEFTASSLATVMTITNNTIGAMPDADAGDTGFAITITQQGAGNGSPEIDADWTTTVAGFNGRYRVIGVPNATEFTVITYEDVNMSNSTGTGSVVDVIPAGDIARSIGTSGALLQIAEVKTTSQEIVDYITTNIPDTLTATLVTGSGTEEVNTSTEDEEAATNYLIGNITQLSAFQGSREVEIEIDTELSRGAEISISGIAGYDGDYIILDTKGTGPTWQAVIYTSVLATTSIVSVVTGAFIGTTPYLLMQDGENIVEITDLQALIGDPQFIAKDSWKEAPFNGEEIKVLATNVKQLEDFWNEQVVTGISNFTSVESSEYGRQLQISSNTFGSGGSIQIIGGKANTTTSAIVGSATELDGKIASFSIPANLRNGMNAGQWIKIIQTAQNLKLSEYSETTVMSLYNTVPRLEMVSSEEFVRQRTIAADSTTTWKIEKQGDFIAIIHIGGTSPLLSTGLVEEGDWVRLSNDITPIADWTDIEDYVVGQKVRFGTKRYLALQNSGISTTPVRPDTDPTVWRPVEWSEVNEGVFQVVRIFGEGSFWIENSNALEELIVQDSGIIEFYDHDSVMPGDEILISTDEFGKENIGRYTVSSETFPASDVVYFTEAPNSQILNVTLGSEFELVQTLEKDTLQLWKKVVGVGQSSNDLATVIVDSPNLMNRISESTGAGIEVQGKLDFTEGVAFGLDSYKSWGGLNRQINRVVYGDPTNPLEYPGVRAAGTDIPINAAIIKRISLALGIRIKTGVPFEEVGDRVKAFAAAYVNSLGVGEQVSLSSIIAAASQVNGVISVTIAFPEFGAGNDLIQVGADEKALILDPTLDIIVSILGT